MRTHIKVGLTALVSALLLASALTTASARNLEVSNQRFRVTWSAIEFRNEFLFVVRCRVTFEGSFHSRTIPKVDRLLIGSITRIAIKEESCGGGTIRPVQPPPWHVTYEGFTGRLPNIETLRLLLQRFQFQITVLGIICKYGTAVDNLTFSAVMNAAAELTNLVPLTGRNIAHMLEGDVRQCPATATLIASNQDGIVTLLNTTTRIMVRLI